jgi:hypothetical protein
MQRVFSPPALALPLGLSTAFDLTVYILSRRALEAVQQMRSAALLMSLIPITVTGVQS